MLDVSEFVIQESIILSFFAVKQNNINSIENFWNQVKLALQILFRAI